MRKKRNLEYFPEKKRMNMFILVVYLVLGGYFINFPFRFIEIPKVVSNFNSWIIFAGGVFMLFGAINYFRIKRV